MRAKGLVSLAPARLFFENRTYRDWGPRHGLAGCGKTCFGRRFVSGHDLGRAVSASIEMRDLAQWQPATLETTAQPPRADSRQDSVLLL